MTSPSLRVLVLGAACLGVTACGTAIGGPEHTPVTAPAHRPTTTITTPDHEDRAVRTATFALG